MPPDPLQGLKLGMPPDPLQGFKTPNYVTFLTSCELAGMHLVVMRRIQLNVFSFYSAELAPLYL